MPWITYDGIQFYYETDIGFADITCQSSTQWKWVAYHKDFLNDVLDMRSKSGTVSSLEEAKKLCEEYLSTL